MANCSANLPMAGRLGLGASRGDTLKALRAHRSNTCSMSEALQFQAVRRSTGLPRTAASPAFGSVPPRAEENAFSFGHYYILCPAFLGSTICTPG